MPIRITCPNCKRAMLVSEHLAGKKGRCKACQHPLTVPPLPNSSPSMTESAPANPQAVAPVDVEAEAAALLADEPKSTEPAEVKTIDFNCPYCDEPIKLSVELAGKRAPCPECKHIIKVPDLVKKDPKDWRKVEVRGPSGARLPDQPAPEGAWGSTTIRGVGTQALVEAGVLPKVERPRTLWQKVRWPILGVSVLLVLSIGSWIGYRWWGRRALEREVQAALAFADSSDAAPTTKAALALAAGQYYLRSRTAHTDPRTGRSFAPAVAANNQFGTALTTLRSAPQDEERDALLADLALAEVELGGDKPDTDQELRLPWDKTQQLLRAILGEIRDGEARLYALRQVAQRLRQRGEALRVLPLTNQLYAAADADKAAALALIGLEFLKSGDQPLAERAAEAALQLYPKDTKAKDAKPLPLRAEVVALALLLEKKDRPAAGEDPDDKGNEQIGKIEALARQGKWEEARKLASRIDEELVQFRARLAIAAAAVDAQLPETTDIEAAFKMAENGLAKKAELSWPMFYLIQLASQTRLPQERVRAAADQISNTALRGRAQLAVFQAQLDQAPQTVDVAVADTIDAKSLARSLAALALARHNVRLNTGYASVVQTWPQPLRAFGALGIALGLQDREK
jgi:predicted negative regulator of RcsB-dependent stress response/DNA-directed RNA polymerase subunit M/transcription elongation factor TFIIS